MQLINIYGGVMTYFDEYSGGLDTSHIIFNNDIIETFDPKSSGDKCGGYEDENLLRAHWDMFKDLGFESLGTLSIDTGKYEAPISGALEDDKETTDIERGLINIASQSSGLAEVVPSAGIMTEFIDDAIIAARTALVAAAYEDMSDEYDFYGGEDDFYGGEDDELFVSDDEEYDFYD